MAYENQGQIIKTQGLFETSTTARHALGSPLRLEDGRVFRYAKMGGTAGVVGKLYQSPALEANHVNQAVAAAAAIGATQVTLTLGATAVTANAYAEGYVHINDAAGEGYVYKIKSHPAADASANVVVTLYDPIQVALTTSSEYTLVMHPCSAIIVHPSPPTAGVVGVPVRVIAADSYGWVQTYGPAICLCAGTPAVNVRVIPSGTVDGAFATGVETDVVPQVGWAMGTAGVDTEYKPVFLTIWS